MRCSEIIEKLEELAPPAYACEWDNVGLLAGRREKEVKKVLVALDATDEVVEQAVKMEADLLLTHHPLIFKPLKNVNSDHFITRRLLALIQSDITYYAMHTNFDAAPGCMADLAAQRLSLSGRGVLEVSGTFESGETYGCGRVGELSEAVSVTELAGRVKEAFGLPFLTVYGEREVTGLVKRAAICPGSGRSMIRHSVTAGADVLITGDIGHHEGIDAAAEGLAVIDAGHYGLEHLFIDFMAQYLEQQCGDRLAVTRTAVCFPAVVI